MCIHTLYIVNCIVNCMVYSIRVQCASGWEEEYPAWCPCCIVNCIVFGVWCVVCSVVYCKLCSKLHSELYRVQCASGWEEEEYPAATDQLSIGLLAGPLQCSLLLLLLAGWGTAWTRLPNEEDFLIEH